MSHNLLSLLLFCYCYYYRYRDWPPILRQSHQKTKQRENKKQKQNKEKQKERKKNISPKYESQSASPRLPKKLNLPESCSINIFI